MVRNLNSISLFRPYKMIWKTGKKSQKYPKRSRAIETDTQTPPMTSYPPHRPQPNKENKSLHTTGVCVQCFELSLLFSCSPTDTKFLAFFRSGNTEHTHAHTVVYVRADPYKCIFYSFSSVRNTARAKT